MDSVARWSQSRRGKAPDPALVRWEAPETFDTETAAEIRTSRLMTPYRALSMAVRNEERAFAFWSYVAGFAEDPEIKKAAEAMAREELGHVATLRKERRRAYHSEHDRMRAGQHGNVGHVDAAVLERRLAGTWPLWSIVSKANRPIVRASFFRRRGACRLKLQGSDDFPPALNRPMPKPSQRLWPMPISMAPRVPMTPAVLNSCRRSRSARLPAWLGCGR